VGIKERVWREVNAILFSCGNVFTVATNRGRVMIRNILIIP
jgi:hypothetical protein